MRSILPLILVNSMICSFAMGNAMQEITLSSNKDFQIELKQLDYNSSISLPVMLTNNTTKTIDLKNISATCTCIRLSPDNNKIEPNGSTSATLILSPPLLYTMLEETISFDIYRMTVTAEVIPLLKIREEPLKLSNKVTTGLICLESGKQEIKNIKWKIESEWANSISIEVPRTIPVRSSAFILVTYKGSLQTKAVHSTGRKFVKISLFSESISPAELTTFVIIEN